MARLFYLHRVSEVFHSKVSAQCSSDLGSALRPRPASELLIGVRMPVLQRRIRVYDRSRGEGVWEDDTDFGPLLSSSYQPSSLRMYCGISALRSADSTVAGRGNALDAIRELRDVLRCAPAHECDRLRTFLSLNRIPYEWVDNERDPDRVPLCVLPTLRLHSFW